MGFQINLAFTQEVDILLPAHVAGFPSEHVVCFPSEYVIGFPSEPSRQAARQWGVPMTDIPLVFRPATELASLIRDGQVTAVQVVDAHLRQIRQWNPQVRAVVSVREADALREAELADAARRDKQTMGPLHGVPITLKDSLRVRGVRSAFGGLPPYCWHRPRTDCKVSERLRQAGAIVIGRTNLPLMALNWQCDNPFYKEGVNPWDYQRTPGGSSGGSAAALAAGFAPLELGTDLGGSIRYPAHCCGVLGLRTTVGLLPIDDIGPEGFPMSFHRLLSLGPMARSVGDLALMLDVLCGSAAPPPVPSHLQAERLHIAVTPSLPGAEPDLATATLLDTLCAGLRADGHEVDVRAAPDVDMEDAWRLGSGELAPTTRADIFATAFFSFYYLVLIAWVQGGLAEPLPLFEMLMAQHITGSAGRSAAAQ
jgi:amidase